MAEMDAYMRYMLWMLEHRREEVRAAHEDAARSVDASLLIDMSIDLPPSQPPRPQPASETEREWRNTERAHEYAAWRVIMGLPTAQPPEQQPPPDGADDPQEPR